MRRSGRGLVALFYGGFALEILAAGVGIAASALPLAARLAPMALAYALMVLAYLRWRRAARSSAEREMWVRIALRLLADPSEDEAVGMGDAA